MIVNKQYYYVALSRVRTLLGLSMTELLEADPEYYTPDTSLLVHDANLAVQTLQTRLRYAEAWNLPVSEVAGLKQELVVACMARSSCGSQKTCSAERSWRPLE